MNKRGFTLIELLAVIVILAIIALIATPIVLNIIKDSKNNAQLRSAEMYVDGVEQAVAKEKMNNTTFNPSTCSINNGNLICDENKENEITVEVKGEKPTSGRITFQKGKVDQVTLTYKGNKTITKDSSGSLVYSDSEQTNWKCKLTEDLDADGEVDIGDLITCGTESFHVISNDGTDIVMLAQYNLNVGTNTYSGGTIGMQNENVLGSKYGKTNYGSVAFSTKNYWYSSGLKSEYGTGYPAYVYDSNSSIYNYVEEYKEKLEIKGLQIKSARLIKKEEIDEITHMFGNKSWLYTTTYYSGSASAYNCVWIVTSNSYYGYLSSGDTSYGNYSGSANNGVRPVIIIPISQL